MPTPNAVPTSLRLSLAAAALAVVSFAAAGRGAESLDDLEQKAFRAAVDRVTPSVLRIETLGGLERVGKVRFGTGPTTGVVVGADGYILSSAFNFLHKPASILVQLPDGSRRPAKVVATDHSRMLTLLKIETDKPLAVPENPDRFGHRLKILGRQFLFFRHKSPPFRRVQMKSVVPAFLAISAKLATPATESTSISSSR